jgi:hypothetical protein
MSAKRTRTRRRTWSRVGFWFLLTGMVSVSCKKSGEEVSSNDNSVKTVASAAKSAGSVFVASPEACNACEKSSDCAQFMDCSKLQGNAPSGEPRQKLCEETLECLRKSNCGKLQAVDCYCGAASYEDCSSGKAKGACREIIERGLETKEPATVLARFLETNYGSGLANRRVDCDTFSCKPQCFAGVPLPTPRRTN